MASPELSMLLEMGFEKDRAETALEITGYQGVEPAMEWLLAHADEQLPRSVMITPVRPVRPSGIVRLAEAAMPNQPPAGTAQIIRPVDEMIVNPPDVDRMAEEGQKAEGAPGVPGAPEGAEGAEASGGSEEAEAKSLKCDECGKLFKTQLEIEYHAAKSGHSSFSESSEEKKPLSEEEKREQLRKLEEKMRAKRAEKEEQEKREALERERMRIKSGKEMTLAKKKLEELEMKKIVEQRKREKIEEKLARERVKEQIEQDRLARKAKFGPVSSGDQEPAAHVPEASPSKASSTQVARDYAETKLQIRLTNGQILTQTFGAKEQLSAVRLYVEMNRTDGDGPFQLMTNFPRKVFADEDFEKPLDVLGLVPSAVVIVARAMGKTAN